MSYRDWHVGMKVVCVDDRGSSTVERGKVYTLARIIDGLGFPDVLGRKTKVAVCLKNVPSGAFLDAFNAVRFCPVEPRKTDISIFTAMLHDQRQKVSA